MMPKPPAWHSDGFAWSKSHPLLMDFKAISALRMVTQHKAGSREVVANLCLEIKDKKIQMCSVQNAVFLPALSSTVESVNRTMPTRSWLSMPRCKYLWFCQVPLIIYFLSPCWMYVDPFALRAQAPVYLFVLYHPFLPTTSVGLLHPFPHMRLPQAFPMLSSCLTSLPGIEHSFSLFTLLTGIIVFLWPKTPTFLTKCQISYKKKRPSLAYSTLSNKLFSCKRGISFFKWLSHLFSSYKMITTPKTTATPKSQSPKLPFCWFAHNKMASGTKKI